MPCFGFVYTHNCVRLPQSQSKLKRGKVERVFEIREEPVGTQNPRFVDDLLPISPVSYSRRLSKAL